MRDDLTHTTANPPGEFAGPDKARCSSTGRASGRISLATLLIAGLLTALVPTNRALALDPTLLFMWCSAGEGETDKRVFRFTSSFGTLIEIDLTCRNNASVIATAATDPSGESLEINSEMDLDGQTAQTTEVVSVPELDATEEKKTIMEREHKVPKPESDDGLDKAKAHATAILEFIHRRTSD